MQYKNLIKTYGFIAGIILVVSAVTKSLDMDVFSILISQYGFGNIRFVAPLIILAEMFIGLLLILRIKERSAAVSGVAMIVVFTLIYLYGLVFKDIKDCGCFGRMTLLNTSPVFTIIRNSVLIYMLITIWLKADNGRNYNMTSSAALLAIMCLISFICGYSYSHKNMDVGNTKKVRFEGSELSRFIEPGRDSMYLVFVFSYSCPHCLNSIENLKQYEASGFVDKVIGIALTDSIKAKKFHEIFEPNFSIQEYPAKTLFKLTKTFPQTYLIKNDSIVLSFSGQLPSVHLLKNAEMDL